MPGLRGHDLILQTAGLISGVCRKRCFDSDFSADSSADVDAVDFGYHKCKPVMRLP
jgi:hypothetical protein